MTSMSAKPPETFGLDRLETPIGTALLVTDSDGVLRALDWVDYEARMRELIRLQYGAVTLRDARSPKDLRTALTQYFKGDLDRLDTIKWRVAGTPFQHKVWTALPRIPAGKTMSYGALAAKLGMPQSDARGRPRQRLKSDQRGRALSPPDRRQRFVDQIWRRARAEAMAAQARGCGGLTAQFRSSFRGARSASFDVQLHIRESITTIVSMDSGPAPRGASRNDEWRELRTPHAAGCAMLSSLASR